MKNTPTEVIEYLENYSSNRSICGPLCDAIDQAIEMIKTIIWQPIKTAPKDREFLGVYWPHSGLSNETFAVFRYDEQMKKFAFSDHSGNLYIPSMNFTLFAWMEIQK